MKLVNLLVLSGAMLSSTASFALSPEALEGKALFPACDVCHNQAMDPPLGPPMWGVQRRYKMQLPGQEAFVQQVVNFVTLPSEDKVIHDEAFTQMGLMPPMPLPEALLVKIATYLYEEEFPPPCDHWKIAVKRAEAKNDSAHVQKEKRQIKRFCQ